MRMLAASLAFFLSQQCLAADLIGGGLKVLVVKTIDDTKVAITIQGEHAAETFVVDCISATWGFDGGTLKPVRADQRSQAIAERACRNVDFKSQSVSTAGAWRSAVQTQVQEPVVAPSGSRKTSVSAGYESAPKQKDRSRAVEASFEECLATRERVISQLNVSASDVIPVVNTNLLTITRVCTADGSVLVSCSRPDNKMIITESPPDPSVGCR